MGICRRDFGKIALAGMAGRLLAIQPHPKLFVLVLVDQIRSDYIDSSGTSLAPGGFRKLMEKGAYFPDCRHLASTFPSSTIATLATGAWPAQHGIVADGWYDRSIRNRVPASDEALLATTLAAQVALDNHSRVTVVSLDAQQGSIFAGTSESRQYWIDESGQFATLGEPPDWLTAYNAQRPVSAYHNQKWTALNAKADAPALRTLTYEADHPKDFQALYRASPYAMAAQFELAQELIVREKLGQGSSLEFLCIITGSTGLLGYETGSRHLLMQQMVLHLDRQLEVLLGALSKTPGENHFNLIVAGAHGAPPEPLTEIRDRMAVQGDKIASAVDRNLSNSASGRVEKYLYPFLYLDTSNFRDPEPIRMAAARAALGLPQVANYFTAGGACSTHNDWERRLRNSFHPIRSGDVMLSYQAEYVEDFGETRGISYGSIYDYDTRVPLFFYGPQFRAGVNESPVESVDLAPTLARAMNIPAPSSSLGRVLGEALAS